MMQNITMIKLEKATAARIKKHRIAQFETYNEIINRLLNKIEEKKEQV